MIVKNNIKTYTVTWLSGSYDKEQSTGIINNYYIPEDISEFEDLCRKLFLLKEDFRIIGHSTNVYLRPNTNIKHLISTRLLNTWKSEGNHLICACGVRVMQLTKSMVDEGVKGFAGMVDLPGTVGGAIYGNASVSEYSIVSLLESVTLLQKNGEVKVLYPEELKFTVRSSALKRHEIDGVILSCKLRKEYGDKTEILQQAMYIHKWRKENQPGPARNLGTTALLDKATLWGHVTRATAKLCCYMTKPVDPVAYKTNIILRLTGFSSLSPYLRGLNRFMWIDSAAHTLFDNYKKFINRIYRNPNLEIEVW